LDGSKDVRLSALIVAPKGIGPKVVVEHFVRSGRHAKREKQHSPGRDKDDDDEEVELEAMGVTSS
jgi:hypothetical protein